jgi:ADP-heptose:LPS heptosyltransferase
VKILIIFPGTLGDLILSTPMISAIKQKYDDAEITMVTGNSNFPAIEDNPKINKIFRLNKKPLKILALIRKLRKIRFDYHIDPKDHKSRESRILAWITNAKTKIGYNVPGRSEVFDLVIPSGELNKGLHFIEKCFRPLQHLEIELPNEYVPRPELFTNNDTEQYLRDFLAKEKIEDYVVVNISASNEYKMWDNEKWVKVIEYIKRNKENIVLSYAPSEKDRAEYLKANIENFHVFKSRSFKDTIALIKYSKLLITPDTSLVHVASAFNKPMIGLYDHNDATFAMFRPLSDTALIIRAKDKSMGIKAIEANEVLKEYESIKEIIK